VKCFTSLLAVEVNLLTAAATTATEHHCLSALFAKQRLFGTELVDGKLHALAEIAERQHRKFPRYFGQNRGIELGQTGELSQRDRTGAVRKILPGTKASIGVDFGKRKLAGSMRCPPLRANAAAGSA
jgi:hypothetical protein